MDCICGVDGRTDVVLEIVGHLFSVNILVMAELMLGKVL